MSGSANAASAPSTTEEVSTTMHAVTYQAYGPVDVLRYEQVRRPHVQPGKVLVQVKAAGVNPVEWHMMTGTPFPVRMMGTGLLKPKSGRLGIDVAGIVVALGDGVTNHAIGDQVYGAARGAYADYVVADADRMNPLPVTMTMEQGGGVAVAAVTALQGLRDKLEIKPGDHVLINGASGGVGTFAVQIAKLLGAEVTGVCSGRNVELVRSLGADHVIDYTTTDFTTGATKYNSIFDNVGSHPFKTYCNVLTDDGVVVAVGGEKGSFGKIILNGLRTAVQSLRASQRATMFVADENADVLADLHEWFSAGTLNTAIDRTYPLEDTAEALTYLATQRARGKVILIP